MGEVGEERKEAGASTALRSSQNGGPRYTLPTTICRLKAKTDPLGRTVEAQVNPRVSGGIQPSLFRLSELADIAHRAI